MSPIIARSALGNRKGFSLAEILMATIIGTMVMASAWSVYMMVWQWWAEMGPRIEIERSARLALLNIVDGVTSVKGLSGYVAGSYSIGSTSYPRRNGIAWATEYPTISSDEKTITYELEDSPSARQFYYGTYNGQGIVYYKHTNGTSYELDSTRGITDLKFEKFVDAEGNPHDNVIKVTVTARKGIYGTRVNQPYTIEVVYTDTAYLRNAL